MGDESQRLPLENGVLVHQQCRPRTAERVAALAERLAARTPERARDELADTYKIAEVMGRLANPAGQGRPLVGYPPLNSPRRHAGFSMSRTDWISALVSGAAMPPFTRSAMVPA